MSSKGVKKVPLRKCVVSRESFDKRDLVRIVKNKSGEVSVDLTGKMHGRGAYIYPTLANVEKARKNKILSRVLEVEVSDDIYNELESIANERDL